MNIQRKNSAHQFRMQSEREQTLVLDSNGSFVDRYLELQSCIFVYRSLNFSTKQCLLINFYFSIYSYVHVHYCVSFLQNAEYV